MGPVHLKQVPLMHTSLFHSRTLPAVCAVLPRSAPIEYKLNVVHKFEINFSIEY